MPGIDIGIGIRVVGSSSGISWTSQYYTLKSGLTWYKREINTAGGYFKLWYSNDGGVTWDTLFTLDLTEQDVVIDLAHLYRHRIVGTQYRVDQTLTALGYAGTENTDWEKIYST